MINDELYLCYINKLGVDIDGFYLYEFLFSDNEQIDVVWGRDWNFKPAGICGDIKPEDSSYSEVKKLKTKIKIDVAQENMCFSMQDCINGAVALGYENIDDPEIEYPEEGPLVLKFGENIKSVEEKLAIRGVLIGWQ